MQQKWKITAVLFAVAALNYGDRTAIASVFPLLRADLDTSDLVLAGIGAVFLWSYAIGSPLAGYLADRISRTRMLLWGLIAWSTITALTGLVHGIAGLLTARAFLGLAECTFIPASFALIADHHGPETRATAMGFQIAGFNIGLIGGSAVAGYLGQHFGWRVDFVILGGVGFLLAIIAQSVLSDVPQAHALTKVVPDWTGVWRLLRMPAYIAVICGAMLIAIGTWVFLYWLPLYLYDRFHLSLAMAGFYGTAAIQIAGIVGVVLGGYFSDRLSGGNPQKRLLILGVSYCCAAPFLLIFLWSAPLGLINLSIFLYSLIQSFGSAGESTIICELAGPSIRSTAMGILNTLNCIAGGLGVLWAEFLKHNNGFGVAFGSLTVTVASAGVIILLVYLLLVRRDRRVVMFS